MLESKIERNFCTLIKSIGGWAIKFVSPNLRGVPDRIVLLPIDDPTHRKIVEKYVYFVECKAPGKKATPQQKRRHQQLKDLGYTTHLIDNLNNIGIDRS